MGKVTTTKIRKHKSPNNNYYVQPKQFKLEYDKSIDLGKPTDKLISMFDKIGRNYITIFGSSNKLDIDACINHAVFRAWEKWDKFNYEVSDNLFSYFTRMIANDMMDHYKYINKGKGNKISIDVLFSNTNKN